jgi:hypothetical protein
MAVIINELEVVLEPPQSPPQPGGQQAVPEKPQFNTQDFLSMWEREQRNRLRLEAH